MQRKGSAILEYALLIIVVVGGFIGVQVYFKRSMQGQYQQAIDKLGTQYAVGLTEGRTHVTSEIRTTIWNLPGPADVIKTKGSFEFNHKRAVMSLDTNRYHKIDNGE
jgi:hypothetical protein